MLELAWQRVEACSGAPARLLACLTPIAADERAVVRELACRACGAWLVRHAGADTSRPFAELLVKAMTDEVSDVRRSGLAVFRLVAKASPAEQLRPLLPLLLLPAAEALTDASAPVKAAAERVVYRVCNVEAGLEQAQAIIAAAGGGPIRAKLTDGVLRRLQREVLDSDDEAAA